MNLPYWAKVAIVGAVIAVATDYFLKPSLNKTLK